jgi:hypothetical protein
MANLTDRGRKVLGKLLAAEKAGPLPDVDKEILADLKAAAGIYDEGGLKVGDVGRTAVESLAETVTAPGRAGRAAAVAYKTALGKPLQENGFLAGPKYSPEDEAAIVESAKRAFSPKYEPAEGEGVASVIGQIAGDIPTLAAGGVLAKAPKLAGPVYRIGRAALEGASLSGASSAAKGEGAADVAKSAALGGAAGGAASGLAEGAGYGLRALGGVVQGQAAAGVGENVISKVAGAADELRGPLGASERVTKAARSIITKAEKSRNSAGQAVGKIRDALGLPNLRDKAMAEFLEDTAQSADDLAKSVRERVTAGVPPGSSPEASLRFLDALKHDLDKLIGWSKLRSTSGGADKIASLDQGALIDIRTQVSKAMGDVPIPGAKALSDAEKAFSKKADAYATLLSSIKSEGSTEALLKGLASSAQERAGLSSGLATGRLSDASRAAKNLGLKRGLEKGTKEAAANILKTAPKSSGVLQNLLRAAGPAGVAKTFSAGRAVEAAGRALPGSKAAVSVGRSLAEALKRKKERD